MRFARTLAIANSWRMKPDAEARRHRGMRGVMNHSVISASAGLRRGLASILPLLFLIPAGAQVQKVAASASPTGTAPQMERPRVARQTMSELEKHFDGQLARIGGTDPIDLLGMTRGIYLEGYGAVFTAEISLIVTPSITPFRPVITDKVKEDVHQRKLDHLRLVEQAMREMVRSTAITFNGAGEKAGVLPPGAELVLAVRLLYLPWENTIGLPGQVIMKADLKNALAGNIQEEIQ